MQKITTLLSTVVFLMLIFTTSVDARRGGGHFAGRGPANFHRSANFNRNINVNRNFNRNVNVDRNVNVNRNFNRTVNVNRNVDVNRNVNVNRRYVYRNGQLGYWRNGAWVAASTAAAAGYVASCAGERRQWLATGSTYWRNRYYQCITGSRVAGQPPGQRGKPFFPGLVVFLVGRTLFGPWVALSATANRSDGKLFLPPK